jgi:hypothetical protein
VLAGEDISLDLKAATAMPGPPGGRRILYYRNPMGLPDTSPALRPHFTKSFVDISLSKLNPYT